MVDAFILSNNSRLNSIEELLKKLPSLDETTFKTHVNEEKNDFATWIEQTFNEPELASSLRKLHTKKQIEEILNKYVKRGHFVYETAIIGAGIAGIAASIYAARKRMDYILFSEDYGGQINVAGNIENYPGFKKTNWKEFGDRLKEQLKHNDVIINYTKIKKIVKLEDGHFEIQTENKTYETETVIITTGARPRKLGVKGEDKYEKIGITYCAICDGPLFKGQEVAVIGGGDSALESVDFLLRIAKHIYLINIGDTLGGHEYLRERVQNQEKVTVINKAKTIEIEGDEKKVTGLAYEQEGQTKKIAATGIFVEIGRIPNTEIAEGLVDLEEKHKHIKIDKNTKTSTPGVFAAGDCTDIHEYQFAIASGEGVKALLSAAKYLQTNSKP